MDIADAPQVRVCQQHHRELVQKLRAPRRARRAVKEDAADEDDDQQELGSDELERQAPFLRQPPADVRGDCKYEVTKRVGPLKCTDLRLTPADGDHLLLQMLIFAVCTAFTADLRCAASDADFAHNSTGT